MGAEWPSPSDVRNDLVSLRRGFGMRYDVMDRAANLQKLRVVRNEAARQGRDMETDAGHVAYDVVRCVAQSELHLGERGVQLLVTTLNLDQSQSALDDRRAWLRTQFNLGEDAYEDFEERTYRQLAGLLLALDTSPCAGEDSGGRDLAQVKREWRQISDQDARLFAEMMLNRLMTSRSHDEAIREAGRILEALPRGQALAEDELGIDAPDATGYLIALLQGVARELYPTWKRDWERSERTLLEPSELHDYLSGVQRYGFEGASRASQPLAEAIWLEVMEGSIASPTPMSLSKAEELIENRISSTFEVLARNMLTLESADNWAAILPDGQDDAAVIEPSPDLNG